MLLVRLARTFKTPLHLSEKLNYTRKQETGRCDFAPLPLPRLQQPRSYAVPFANPQLGDLLHYSGHRTPTRCSLSSPVNRLSRGSGEVTALPRV